MVMPPSKSTYSGVIKKQGFFNKQSTAAQQTTTAPASTPAASASASVPPPFSPTTSLQRSPRSPLDHGGAKKTQRDADNSELQPAAAAAASESAELAKVLKDLVISVQENGRKMDNLNATVATLKESVAFMSQRQDAHDDRNMHLEAENQELKQRLLKIEQRQAVLEADLCEEATKRDNSENVSRKQALEFSGLPKETDGVYETDYMCKQKVAAVMKHIGATSTIDTIDDAHRKRNGQMIARFKDRTSRNEVYERRFALFTNKVTSNDIDGLQKLNRGYKIFINESLTFDRSKLARVIREKLKVINAPLPKDKKFRFRTNGGQLNVENVTKSRFVKVSSIDDFDGLHPNNIVIENM